MDTELKQFLHDQKRFKRGLPPEPLPFSRNPRPVVDAPRPAARKVVCPDKPRHVTPSKLRRRTAHMAKFGIVYDPNYKPPTRDQLFKRQPQWCRECGNGWAKRVLLPPARGQFFKERGVLRWVCHHCTGHHNDSVTSPGENRLRALLKENGVPNIPQHVIEGLAFDFYLPKWNLIVEVDSWSAHHTAAQKKKDHHRNKTAKRLHIHLLRVKWNDHDMLPKVLRARRRGQDLRRQSKLVQRRKPPRVPCRSWAISV